MPLTSLNNLSGSKDFTAMLNEIGRPVNRLSRRHRSVPSTTQSICEALLGASAAPSITWLQSMPSSIDGRRSSSSGDKSR